MNSLILHPPEVFLALTKAGVRKAAMRWDMILIQSIMAGFYVATSGVVSLALAGGLKPEFRADYPAIGKLASAILFPTGLICIMVTGAELFTGNTMTLVCAWLERKVTIWDLLRHWGIVFVGNLIGCVFTAFFFGWLPNTLGDPHTKKFITGLAEKKVRLNWGIALVKAIGCNAMVCISIWLAVAAQDGASKVIMLWPPIVCFVMAGFEHSIANLFFIPVGMMYGANVSFFQLIFLNLIPVIIGNIIGGGFVIGCTYWYEFHPRDVVNEDATKAASAILASAISSHFDNMARSGSAMSLEDAMNRSPGALAGSLHQSMTNLAAAQGTLSPRIKGMQGVQTPPKHVEEVREDIRQGQYIKPKELLKGVKKPFSKKKGGKGDIEMGEEQPDTSNSKTTVTPSDIDLQSKTAVTPEL
eukprot:Platyproteum_vivax@DN6489_c0_g1_i2.p1